MKEKLALIYNFLLNNRKYNKELQEKYYKSLVLCHNNVKEKVLSLLYDIANSQSKPKIDNLSKFYQDICKDTEVLTTFLKFVKKVSNKENGFYGDLYNGLKVCSGWGPKTSALFVKTVFHMHNGKYDAELKFWDDAPDSISNHDCIYLPVDKVIIEIFKIIEDKSWTFDSINKKINECYKGEEIEVWDDLWFWGFITQRVEDKGRVFGWNPNKYWLLRYSNKDGKVIKEIEEKSKAFLKLYL